MWLSRPWSVRARRRLLSAFLEALLWLSGPVFGFRLEVEEPNLNAPNSVLKTALQGEDHAVEAYEKALKENISTDTRVLAEPQLGQI